MGTVDLKFEQPDAVHEPPMRTARRYADAELGSHATEEETKWLYAHKLLWLRALAQIRRDVESHIAKDRRSLEPLKPPAGTHASSVYLRAKSAMEHRSIGRVHFLQVVDRRTEEVKSLLGPDPLDHRLVGDMIQAFERIADAIETDDLDGAHDLALSWSTRLSGERW